VTPYGAPRTIPLKAVLLRVQRRKATLLAYQATWTQGQEGRMPSKGCKLVETAPRMLPELQRLRLLLERIGSPRADEIDTLIALCRAGDARFWRRINDNRLWAGAGSLAAETLADNPGIDAQSWYMEVREFRELLVAIGTELNERGGANPGIQSWIMAFEQWNASGV
jgi:hypothetical protein